MKTAHCASPGLSGDSGHTCWGVGSSERGGDDGAAEGSCTEKVHRVAGYGRQQMVVLQDLLGVVLELLFVAGINASRVIGEQACRGAENLNAPPFDSDSLLGKVVSGFPCEGHTLTKVAYLIRKLYQICLWWQWKPTDYGVRAYVCGLWFVFAVCLLAPRWYMRRRITTLICHRMFTSAGHLVTLLTQSTKALPLTSSIYYSRQHLHSAVAYVCWKAMCPSAGKVR